MNFHFIFKKFHKDFGFFPLICLHFINGTVFFVKIDKFGFSKKKE